MLAVLINRDWCALHWSDEDGPMYLLEGLPTDATPATLDMEFQGLCTFTRSYLHPLATGEAVIRAFAAGESWPDGLRWVQL
jgi:hypothetical protein